MKSELIKAYIEVLNGFLDGKEFQIPTDTDDDWETAKPQTIGHLGSCMIAGSDVRVKPEPATRPWSKPEDVPGPVCWIRYKCVGEMFPSLVIGFSKRGCVSHLDGEHCFYSWTDMRIHEYSTDRKTWFPCTVTK